MKGQLTVHYDALQPLTAPMMWIHLGDGQAQCIEPSQHHGHAATFTVEVSASPCFIKFSDGDAQEADSLWRRVTLTSPDLTVWCRSWHAFVLLHEPAPVDERPADQCIAEAHFAPHQYISESGGRFALGANVLAEGGVQFGFFHPHAARVYVCGTFNDWQHPAHEDAQPERWVEMTLHRGYFDVPNVWLAQVPQAKPGDEYQFYVQLAMQVGEHAVPGMLVTDPYARCFGADYEQNPALVVDPAPFPWEDAEYQTPLMHEIIIYELHPSGFTVGHSDVPSEHQGKYAGIVDRINAGYFDALGVNCLYLMPVAEAPTPQGPNALGYNTAVFTALERDFGTPAEFKQLVNEAHKRGMAVIVDQVFNHTANEFNPLWKLILDHPDEWERGDEGGLYFSGESPWGNRTATERAEMQNMLIDACKLMVIEYHIDGFRFDYTHSSTMHHGFLNRLADELQALKPDILLIAENMPNESDLNRGGYNGFAQWHDRFHDGIKALLREGPFEAMDDHPEVLGEMFYFSKGEWAAHTNNVVNYCESHDENSVAYEVATNDRPGLDTPQAKARKARLGLGASIVALGQPMIYMGQEFALERERNFVHYPRPDAPQENPFFVWTAGLMHLRRRYAGLKLHGFDPIADGQFRWIIAPWMDAARGGGKRVIGWQAAPNDNPLDTLVILLNFENHPVPVQLELGHGGVWVCLATIDEVNDLPPTGSNGIDSPTRLLTPDGFLPEFVLPDSSLFVYKWQGLPAAE
jgi:1,4-alpha-glucan branching enzyme